MTPTGRALLKAFEHPDDWTLHQHRASYKDGRIHIWIGNGLIFFQTEPLPLLGFFERIYLWYKFWQMVHLKTVQEIHKELRP